MLVGECAGQVKVTSHGGIYYGMLGARIGAETLAGALARNGLSAEGLQSYESRWRELIEPEIQAGLWLRRRLGGAGGLLLGGLMSLGRIPGVMGWIESHADFDWHRGLIDAGRARLSWSPTPGLSPRILDPSSAGGR